MCGVPQGSVIGQILLLTAADLLGQWSLVLQRLDYGNAMLAGIPSHLIKQMQSVLNSAARLVFSAPRYDRITPLLTVALAESAGAHRA